MRDIMFEIPSNPKIEKCIITKETVEKGDAPKIIINNNREIPKKSKTKRATTNKRTGTAQKNEEKEYMFYTPFLYMYIIYKRGSIWKSKKEKI